MALALDLTKNIRCNCSKTFNCTLVRTKPCKTVALSRSSHLCRDSSRSRTGTDCATSRGPHSMNSNTDFAWFKETARSSCIISFNSGVSFCPGSKVSTAFNPHLQSDVISSSVLLFMSSDNLWSWKMIFSFLLCDVY